MLWYEKVIEQEYEDVENQKKYFKNGKLPEVIYILPVNFDYQKNAKEIFDYQSEIKRQEIIKYFEENNKKVVVLNDVPLFNDGIHLNYDGHRLIADMIRKCYFEK